MARVVDFVPAMRVGTRFPFQCLALKRLAQCLLVAGWITAVYAGFLYLCRYDNTPGAVRGAPLSWPADSVVRPNDDGYTLLIFAHPHCPCTRATLAELARLMAHCRQRIRAQVVFVVPRGRGPGWVRGDLWAIASSLPGVRVMDDLGGMEARRFGAETSGQALLYDAQGHLRFHGGITAARGHEGDNLGRARIVATVLGHASGWSSSGKCDVFGCPLDTPRSAGLGET